MLNSAYHLAVIIGSFNPMCSQFFEKTREISLGRHAKIRMSSSPRGNQVVCADGVLNATVTANPEKSYGIRFLSVEVLIPRGGRAEYGMLSVEYDPDSMEEVDLVVPYSPDLGQIWLESLAAAIDTVVVGLPLPYAIAVMDVLQTHGGGVFSPGKIVVREAAHGDVGSSESLFERLTEAAIVLLAVGREDVDKNTIDRLHTILL